MAVAAATPPRRKRWLRWVLLVPAALFTLVAAALGVAVARFDPEAQKPRIAAAVEARTGRQLTLAGPVGLKFSLFPTVTLENVALANMPGGSRPEMARVGRVEAEFALLPLLSRRLELRRLVLRAPDILLETDTDGRPNWAFAPMGAAPPPGSTPADAQPAPTPSAPAPETAVVATPRPPPLSVERVAVSDGRFTYRNGQTGRTRTLAVERFRTEPVAGADGLLRFDGAAVLDDLPVTAQGEAGGPARLFGASEASPWPVRLTVAAGGAEARVEGSASQPLRGRGWRVAVAAKVSDLARFAATTPNLPTPPLRDLDFAATLSDPGPEAGRRFPRFSDLRVSVGANDLSWLWPGLRLSGFRADVPRDDAPFAVEAQASAGDIPLRLSGSLGAPRRLLFGAAAPEPWPIDLGFGAGAATAAIKGRIADITRGALGFDLELALRVPDLAALSPLAGRPLPAVRDLSLDSRVAERGRGFGAGAFFRGLRVSSSAGDAAGDLTYVIGQRQGLLGELASRRLDLDALLPPPAAAAAPEPGAAAPPKAPKDGRLVPDLPLPWAALRVAEGNLRWTLEELVAGGVPMRQVLVAVAVEDGRARLDPFLATLPGGQAMVRGSADGTADPPALQVSAQAANFDLAPTLAAFKVPPRVAGRLDLDADLRGAGRDLRTVVGGLSGHLGLALVDGAFDAALLEGLPPELRRAVMPQGAGAGGAIPFPCGALRVQAETGTARLRALLAETGIGRVSGEGGVNLRDETLAIRLLPDLRVGNVALRAPVNVAGTLAAPRVGVSREAAVAAGLGALLSLQRTPDRDLQALAGAFGGGSGPPLPDCASQLAAARGGRAGALPSSSPPSAAQSAPAPSGGGPGGAQRDLPRQAEEVLRGLFGRGR
jgi:AsmA family protein